MACSQAHQTVEVMAPHITTAPTTTVVCREIFSSQSIILRIDQIRRPLLCRQLLCFALATRGPWLMGNFSFRHVDRETFASFLEAKSRTTCKRMCVLTTRKKHERWRRKPELGKVTFFWTTAPGVFFLGGGTLRVANPLKK